MGIKYSFVDNEIYGTEDINEIVGCLTGAGIAPFPVQDAYDTSIFNTITEALVSSGVSLDGCICTVSGAGTVNMKVSVSQGIIFFESGVRLIVDEDGYTVSVSPNTSGHIIAHYNSALQTADIIFSADLPTDGEYTELAQIYKDGTAKDMRVFARSKVATFGANATFDTTFTALEAPTVEVLENDNNYTYGVISKRLDADISKFNYAIIKSGTQQGIFDLTANTFLINYALPSGNQGYVTYATIKTNLFLGGYGSPALEIYVQDGSLIAKQRGEVAYDYYPSVVLGATLI